MLYEVITVYVAAERIENATELDGNIAAAGNQDALRTFFEGEEIVGYDAESGARNVGHHRPASGRDDDAIRTIVFIADRQGMRVDKLRGTRNMINAASYNFV